MHGQRGLIASAILLASLTGCGGVSIAPEPMLPRALVTPVSATVGYVVGGEQRNYVHTETRGGVPWKIALGAGHQKLVRQMFVTEFREAREFDSVDAARKVDGLQAIFEPRIDQYSFATSAETGGRYVAVTIRYRINVFTPDGARADTLSLMGYGASLVGDIGGEEPLALASRAAMRDAAAKFLTQFQGQSMAEQLAEGEKLSTPIEQPSVIAAAVTAIEALPIRPSRRHPISPST